MKCNREITLIDIVCILGAVLIIVLFGISIFTGDTGDPQEVQKFFSAPLQELQFRHIVLLFVLWRLLRGEK